MPRRFPNSRRQLIKICIAAMLFSSLPLGWSQTPALAAPTAPAVRGPDRRMTRERPLPAVSRRGESDSGGPQNTRSGPSSVRHTPR